VPKSGGLAHLARALRWQRRGGRFESDILHYYLFDYTSWSFLYIENLIYIVLYIILKTQLFIELFLFSIKMDLYYF
jgi:hypothetical protein